MEKKYGKLKRNLKNYIRIKIKYLFYRKGVREGQIKRMNDINDLIKLIASIEPELSIAKKTSQDNPIKKRMSNSEHSYSLLIITREKTLIRMNYATIQTAFHMEVTCGR